MKPCYLFTYILKEFFANFSIVFNGVASLSVRHFLPEVVTLLRLLPAGEAEITPLEILRVSEALLLQNSLSHS